jgi:hypothetical protein
MKLGARGKGSDSLMKNLRWNARTLLSLLGVLSSLTGCAAADQLDAHDEASELSELVSNRSFHTVRVEGSVPLWFEWWRDGQCHSNECRILPGTDLWVGIGIFGDRDSFLANGDVVCRAPGKQPLIFSSTSYQAGQNVIIDVHDDWVCNYAPTLY